MHWLTVQPRPVTTRSRKHLIAERIIDHPSDHLAVLVISQARVPALTSQHHAEHRKSMREVGGAIQWVDIPAKLAAQRGACALFPIDTMVRKRAPQALRD